MTEQLKALIVDDELINRALLARFLPRIGFAVETAENGQEALTKAQTWHPDVVLMDMMMPVMDGMETARCLRANIGADRPVIIAVSANTTMDSLDEIFAAGFNDFIAKPVAFDKLEQLLHKHLNN